MMILNLVLVTVSAVLLLTSEHLDALRLSPHGRQLFRPSIHGYRGLQTRSMGLKFRVADVDPSPTKPLTKVAPVSPSKGKPANDVTASSRKDHKQHIEHPATTLQRLSLGIVPVAATLGFALVPSQKLAFRAAGAAAGGVAGILAKKSFDQYVEHSRYLPEFSDLSELQKEIDEEENGEDDLISDANFRSGYSKEVIAAVKTTLKSRADLLTYTEEALEKIAHAHGVKENELSLYFTVVLSEAIHRETKGTSLDLLELSAIIDFVEDIGFSRHEVGNAFGFAALKIGRQLKVDERGFFAEQFPMTLLVQAAKLFFLADKMITNMEGFYGKRVSMLLNSFFVEESYQLIITETCRRLFSQCVQSVLASSSSKISRDDVERLEQFLATSTGLSELTPSQMQTLIMEAVRGKLDADLKDFTKANALQAVLPDFNVYTKARDVFGWSHRDMMATLDEKLLPVYRDIVDEVLRQVTEQPDAATQLATILPQKAKDLRLEMWKARSVIIEAVSIYNRAYVDRIQKVYEASGQSLPAVYKIMVHHATIVEGFDVVTRDVMGNDRHLPIPGLPFQLQTRQLLYEHRQEQHKRQQYKAESALNELFDLDEPQRLMVQQAMATPKIMSWITQCITEKNFAAEARAVYQKMLDEFRVTDDEWQPTALDFYYQEVKRIAEGKAIPTLDDMTYLAQVQRFVSLRDKLAHDVHVELFGEKYMKAVTEAMTPSGIIADDYVAGLVRLRERLGFSEEDSRVLAAVTTRNRFVPMFEGLVDIWKSNTDPQYRWEKEQQKQRDGKGAEANDATSRALPSSSKNDAEHRSRKVNSFGFMSTNADGDSSTTEEEKESNKSSNTPPGPGNFMRETLNMVDMVASAMAVHGVDLTAAATASPVTAVSLIAEEDLIGLYKYFLIGRVSEGNAQLRQRYDAAETILVKLMGISEATQQRVKESVAYSSYKSLLHNALLHKDRLESSDLQQFIRLKKALPLLSEERAEAIYIDARRHALIDHASALFGKFLGNTTNDLSGQPYPMDPVLQSAFPQLKTRPITPADARVFREQVTSLGFTIQEIGFSPVFVSLLFAMEVQDAIETQREDELRDLQELYDFEASTAVLIIEASVKRYLSQVIALALSAAKRFNEPVAVDLATTILRYLPMISDTVKIAADGNLFRPADVERLVSFYLADVDNQITEIQQTLQDSNSTTDETERLRLEEQLATLSQLDRRATADRFQRVIFLTKDFVPPQQGIAGLMGKIRRETNDEGVDLGKERKKWSWD